MTKRFHCCATCIHFIVEKQAARSVYKCSRLQYETKPAYQFNCWQPKKHIRDLIEKEKEL